MGMKEFLHKVRKLNSLEKPRKLAMQHWNNVDDNTKTPLCHPTIGQRINASELNWHILSSITTIWVSSNGEMFIIDLLPVGFAKKPRRRLGDVSMIETVQRWVI